MKTTRLRRKLEGDSHPAAQERGREKSTFDSCKYSKYIQDSVEKISKLRWMDQNITDRKYSTSLPEEDRHGQMHDPCLTHKISKSRSGIALDTAEAIDTES